MRFKIEDREYEFDGEYTVAEAMLFFDKAGVGMSELYGAMQRGNPYVAATLMYILKRRAGEAVRWQDMENLPANALQPIPDDDTTADAPGTTGEAPDPTEGSGTTPAPDTATTS